MAKYNDISKITVTVTVNHTQRMPLKSKRE